MSLSWLKTLRVSVAPHGAAALVLSRPRARVLHKSIWEAAPCAAGERPWQPTLDAMRANLIPRFHSVRNASVTLSNHFCRYALLPKHEGLATEAEVRAYAHARLRARFGDVAQDWDLQIDVTRDAILVCAVEGALLEELRGLFAGIDVQLRSIQPFYAAAFARARPRIARKSGWFVVQERGLAVISRFDAGRWTCLTTRRTPADTAEGLAATFSREQRLQWRFGDAAEPIWLTTTLAGYTAADFTPLGLEVSMLSARRNGTNPAEDELQYALAA